MNQGQQVRAQGANLLLQLRRGFEAILPVRPAEALEQPPPPLFLEGDEEFFRFQQFEGQQRHAFATTLAGHELAHAIVRRAVEDALVDQLQAQRLAMHVRFGEHRGAAIEGDLLVGPFAREGQHAFETCVVDREQQRRQGMRRERTRAADFR